jgi:squalene-hopene/tetraprenyl-beta-curcumene cyclase
MAGDRRPLAPLVESIDCYNCARQMLDDLSDWKEDLEAGMPSLLLARALGEKPSCPDDESFSNLQQQVAREIFYNGHASYVLTLALRKLDEADAALRDWPKLAWRKVHRDLRNECSQLLSDIERIVRENVVRVNQQPNFALHLPTPTNECESIAWQALDFMIEQWRRGFGEARHVMHFPPELGFGGPAYQRGDIFQRALIADALCDVEQAWNVNLRPVIDHEIAYLLSRRDTGRGGWSYFSELPELPADADDLAQILQLLHRCGRHAEVKELCSGPVSVLLEDNSHADGSFETWIIPARNRNAREERQAEFARDMWGTGADAEVIANLLYALALIDSDRFGDHISRGVEYLERQQLSNGTWTSTWYHGPFYSLYVCLRLLAHVRPNSNAIPRAAAFLNKSQKADGGWGNPLDTALGLLSLFQIQTNGELASVSNACDYLQAHAMPDGSWIDCEFIRMDLGRAARAEPQIVSYGSRTITTAFVLKALAASTQRDAWRNCRMTSSTAASG